MEQLAQQMTTMHFSSEIFSQVLNLYQNVLKTANKVRIILCVKSMFHLPRHHRHSFHPMYVKL